LGQPGANAAYFTLKTFIGENQILPLCPDLDGIDRIANNTNHGMQLPQT
jgi:hypothetical protein